MSAVTEKQAAGMWCPQVRMTAHSVRSPQEYTYDELAFNRSEPMADATRCIGARCMAWRWSRDPDYLHVWADDRQATVEPTRPPNLGPDWEWLPFDPNFDDFRAGWREPEVERRARRSGYCGLAGAP